MANPEHLAKLKKGVKRWNQWREQNPRIEPDLSGANLQKAYLYGANLSGTDLSKADLRGRYLTEGDLSGAHLSGANLRGAHLREANLSRSSRALRNAPAVAYVLGDGIMQLAAALPLRFCAQVRSFACSESVGE